MSISEELGLDQPMEDIRHEAVLNIVRTANVLSLRAGELFRAHDCTEAQFNVLFALKYKQSDWTQSDLSRRLVVTRASITSVLDKLEQKEWVKRVSVPGNRRIYHVELMPSGWALVNDLEPRYREIIHGALTDFDDADCVALTAALEKVRAQAAVG